MGLLSGKRCLIMGVANKRSIGWGIAQSLHREGASLAFTYQTDRLKENVDELVQTLDDHDQIPVIPCDVSVEGQIEACFGALGQQWGQLDVLIHSMAYARTEDLQTDFLNFSRDGWKLNQEVSAWSLVGVSKAAKPLMEAAGGGSIITLTYMASERVVERYNLAPAKAALECSVRYLAYELGPSNIRVNAISAGALRTLASSAVKGVSKLRDAVEERAPLRRNITQEEVGDVGLFLASNLSRCITGEVIHADNGFNILGV